MDSRYNTMWDRLGLDLPTHDNLLKVLGNAYGDVYLSQEGRPKGAGYLDFVLSEVHGLRIQELLEAKQTGKKVVGTFCIFVPEEIIWSAGGVSVGLCAGAEIGKEQAERVLPRNTCALIKSFMGFKLARVCPFFESCDLLIGETTCDGKKKAFEILAEHAPVYVMEIPQMKDARDRELWRQEVARFMDRIQELTGTAVTEENLSEAIRAINDRRRVLQRLNRLRKAKPTPISGRDALLVNQISFYDDPRRFTQKIGELCDELEARFDRGEGIVPAGTPRILVSGCPMALPNWKVVYAVESSGAVIVGEESCIGTRNTRDLVREDGGTLQEMVDHLVDRYMKIDCACFTPNTGRLEHVMEMARDLGVDGVIHYALQFCHPYTIEAYRLEDVLKKAGVPVLRLETDYGNEDTQILKNRVEAFVEMLR